MYCRSYYLLCLLFLLSSGSGRPTKITRDVLSIVEAQMQADDETTAVQLQKLLVHVDNGHPLSLKTILAEEVHIVSLFVIKTNLSDFSGQKIT